MIPNTPHSAFATSVKTPATLISNALLCWPVAGSLRREGSLQGIWFGKYRLIELLGRGGMGEVYRAYDTKTDRIVALKVFPTDMAQDAMFQHRFRRESQAAAGLNEPHVVPIHSYGEIDGRLYLDMRLIEGRNLGTILNETEKPLGPAFSSMVVDQVAAALDAAHEGGLDPSGRQAVEHPGHRSRFRVSDRLRSGPHRRRGRDDHGREHAGHASVHGAGAVRRRAGRSAVGHLRVDVCALRMSHGLKALSG